MRSGTAPLAVKLRSRSGVAVSAKKVSLTEYESLLLAIIARDEPTTAYKICKVVERSPTAGFSSSAGAVYPIVGRLKARGLVTAAAVEADGRNTELLLTTKGGRAAVRKWITQATPDQLLPVDPLRTRILSFDMLSRDERLEWIVKAKALVKQRRAIVEEYNQSVTVPYQDFAYASVMEALRVKMEWLDELLFHVAPSD